MILKTLALILIFGANTPPENPCNHTLCSVSHLNPNKVREWQQAGHTACTFSDDERQDPQAILWHCNASEATDKKTGYCMYECEWIYGKNRVQEHASQF